MSNKFFKVKKSLFSDTFTKRSSEGLMPLTVTGGAKKNSSDSSEEL